MRLMIVDFTEYSHTQIEKSMKREKDKYSIQAVENALNVLEQFKGQKGELGITELSQNLDLHKNNIFRLLATLESRGYIEQNKNNEHYRLGIKALELGKSFLSHTGLIKVAVEMLEELCHTINETVYLGIMKQNQVFFIEGWEAQQALRVASRLGERMSPLCTATGKIILAYCGGDERDAIIEQNEFIRYTDHTILTKDAFLEELEKTRENGFAIDNEEKDEGIVCVAGPVYNYNDHIVASISASGPRTRMTEEVLHDFYIGHVLECCKKVSRAIGYTGYS